MLICGNKPAWIISLESDGLWDASLPIASDAVCWILGTTSFNNGITKFNTPAFNNKSTKVSFCDSSATPWIKSILALWYFSNNYNNIFLFV